MIRKSPDAVTVLSYQRSHRDRHVVGAGSSRTFKVCRIERRELISQHTPVRVDVTTASATSTLWIGEGTIEQLPTLLDAHHISHRRFVVSSPVIWRLHGERLQQALGSPIEPILVADGERYKNLQSVSRIYDALIRGGADRGSALLAFGGGVIGDTAGFAAATYLRGMSLVQIPTTLLAQVDSSVGGKVGVNLPTGKNLVGAFHQAAVVVIDPLLLKTLPRREFRSGLYEVVKYGMIASRALFDLIANDTAGVFDRQPALLVPAIVESCRIKARVVTEDERESGLRRILNFGHTIGHALEAVTRYRRFKHGEAIAYGMLGAADLAVHRGALAEDARQALASLITTLGPLPPIGDLPIADVLAAIKRDKKVLHGRLHFVVATAIGATTTVNDVSEDELRGVLERLGMSHAAATDERSED
jgi:3-dehydroquinate synthase